VPAEAVREALACACTAAAKVGAAQRRLARGGGRPKRALAAIRADAAAAANVARFGRPPVDAILGDAGMAHAARMAALAEARAALEAKLRAVGMFRLEVGARFPTQQLHAPLCCTHAKRCSLCEDSVAHWLAMHDGGDATEIEGFGYMRSSIHLTV
jgi:hypothetical protein